jgi:hypothetical protein
MPKSETVYDVRVLYSNGQEERYDGVGSVNLVPAGIPVLMLFNQLDNNLAIIAMAGDTRVVYENPRPSLSVVSKLVN